MTITRLLTRAAVMLLLAVLGLTPSYGQMQKATLVRGGESIGFYYGADALKSALTAAAASGDMIVLSTGTFNEPEEITKSVSIYGQGFEDPDARTFLNGKLKYRSTGEGSVDNIHLEGLYIGNHLNLLNDGNRTPIHNLVVVKCFVTGMFIYMDSEGTTLQNCVIQGDIKTYPGSYQATDMLIENCWKDGGSFNCFSTDSEITVRNCIFHGRYISGFDSSTSYIKASYVNCVLSNCSLAANSTATNCVFIGVNTSASGVTVTDCYTASSASDVFTNVTSCVYAAGVTPTVKDEFVGTDGTAIGLTGGTLGWDTQTTTIAPDLVTTLTKDSEGYYQLASVADWVEFARIVAIDNTVCGRMTEDIDLDDDQTMVGDGYYPNANQRVPFRGIFDGQGHTLTVNYVTANLVEKYTNAGLSVPSYLGCAPFGYVWGGIIRNLHTAGTITATHEGDAGIVGWTNGSVLIENCHSSVDITFTDGHRGAAGITYDSYNDSHVLTINDCVYDGTLTAGTNKTGSAGFVVYRPYGTVNINNSLLAATYGNGLGTSDCATFVRNPNGVISYSYFQTALGTVQGSQATATELANGRTAFYLQNGRTDLVWGQLIGTDPLPILTNDESKRVYRSANGYTNNPDEAIPDQSLQPFLYTRDNQNNLTINGFDPGFTPPANYALVIPDEIDGAPVTAIANNAFQNKTNFVSLTVGNNVATIGQSAFAGCTALTTVSLPANGALTTMNNSVFNGCTALTSLVIPNSVTTMGSAVFFGCSSLATATFADGCQLTTLPNETFRHCTALTTFTIPTSVNTIGLRAFGNSGLTSITFPANVTNINGYAFEYCASLTDITLPATITTLNGSVFYRSGVQTATIYCASIANDLFNGCSKLEALTIGDGLTTIGVSAFNGCSKLATVNIPASVNSIGGFAFANTPLLETVTIAAGSTLQTIPNNMFQNATKLDGFVIPASVTTISNNAFEGCTSLTSLVIPNTVTTLGEYMLRNCTAMTSVTISSQVTILPSEAFRNCQQLDNVVIPSSVTEIRSNVFVDCKALTSIVIPNSVTTMGNSVFTSCTSLATATFETGCQLTTIPDYTFNGCTALTTFTVPASVTTIGTSAFYNCTLLASVSLPQGLTTINNNAFRYCSSLNNVVLPGTLTSIKEWSFANCTSMENLTIEEGVTSINHDVFQYSGMKNVVLPSTLGAIGINLFYQCNQLQTLDVSKCVNVWELYYYTSLRGNNTIFNGVPTTTKIILPPYAQATLGPNDEIATLTFDLTADTDGYYLINTATDWDKFVVYSRANPTVNGRITADINLTSHVGKLGVGSNESNYITYQGTVDGQNHTLTIQYRTAQDVEGGLFAYVENATIQNLKVNGTITANHRLVGGFVGFVKPASTLTMQDCESDVNFTVTPSSTNMNIAGFIGQGKTATITLTDCLYNGTITGVSSFRYAAPFLGWKENSGTITYNYCLNNGDFVNLDKNYTYALGATQNNGQSTAVNCYYRSNNVTNNESLAQSVSDAQLESGYVTFRLQGTRPEQHWGQLLGTDLFPRLTDEEGTRVYRGQTYTNEPTAYTGFLQDEDGYYLIGGTADWEEFCIVVEEFPLSNARMTNDVTVVDNTMIGDVTTPYSGIFDGQGHTLTINYDRTGLAYSQSMDYGAAPFLYIQNATIKNLHVDGSIHTSTKFAAGVVGDVKGSQSLIENCRSSVNITSSVNGEGCMGGVVSHMTNGHTVFIRDCHFDGSFDAPNAWGNGGIMGYKNGTATIENCFFAPSALSSGSNYSYCIMRQGGGTTTINNCYYTQQLGSVQGTAATTEQLADGTVTTALQANRTEEIWVQDPVTNQPMLKTFISLTHLTQDADGYYLLGSVQDWQDFATLVQTTPTANAKMTADIDLGDDQTMVGTYAVKYQGTFDGQGHTLTINYNTSGMTIESPQQYLGAAPFRDIQNATIRNLHTAGTVTADKIGATGLVGWAYGENTIERCWSSVDIVSSNNTADTFSGFVFRQDGSLLTMNDCYYSGMIQSVAKKSHAGFVGHHTAGTAILNNCLVIFADGTDVPATSDRWTKCYTFVRNQDYSQYIITLNNCYYKTAFGTPQGTQATTEELADGTTATALQAGRAEEIWVQDPVTNQPMLALFANTISFNGDGSEDNPFIITTTAELDYLAFLVNGVTNFYGKYFKLGNDIEYNPNVLTIDNNGDGVNDSNYTPIGNGFYIGNNGSYPFEIYSFQGYFDGDGHTISGIRIYRDSITDDDKFQGIFGFLSDYSRDDSFNTSVCNLTVTDTEITGFWNIGGVIGYNNERVTIENCHVANNVVLHVIKPGSQNIGGIVGHNSGNVAHCSSAVTITVTSDASNGFNTNKFGGLVGTNTNHGILANNLVIGATIPVSNTNTAQAAGKEYGAILGWATSSFSITRHNYYSACTVAGVPNATNVGCGDSFGPHDLNDNNGAVPGNVRTVAAPNVWISEDPENESIDGWAFIASPLTDDTDPESTSVENIFSATDYDLYRLNPSNTKWENWKVGDGNNAASGFSLENGRGYLYATQETDTIKFNGEADEFNLSDTTEVALSQGFNLVGNPFPRAAYINKPYYTLNADGSAVSTSTSTAYIPPCYGVVVDANEGETVTFTTTAPAQQNAVNNGNLQIAVSQVPELVEGPARDKGGVSTGSTTATLDNAIVSFNEGERLGKFYFGSQNANIYLPQNGKDYAIAYSEKQGEMPLNFKASKSGEYCLSVNPEGVEMAYLHLIDNLTGADVDLLSAGDRGSEPAMRAEGASYIFTARTTDYESRFKLVFVANNGDGSSTGSETFAFYSNGNWIISNEGKATLQVIDVNGRILSSETVNGSVSKAIHAAPGVYVLRLINGNDLKTQKIVVR